MDGAIENISASEFDAIVVGGGPAGASCALWLRLLGFSPAIIEQRTRLGGLQNDSPYQNEWIAPLVGLSGREVAYNIHRNIVSRDIACFLATSVKSIVRAPGGFIVHAADLHGNRRLLASHVVLASGVRPANGGLSAGPRMLIGPGASITDTDFSGRSVAILGGGDNAFENFHFIRERGAAEVHVYARTVRARREFIEKTPREYLRTGQYSVDGDAMTVSGSPYDFIVVLYGWFPNLDYVDEFNLARDSKGFIATDSRTTETSVPNVFAIGEVAQRMHPCCVTSMADGVVAAKEIQRRIEAGSQSTLDACNLAAIADARRVSRRH